MPKAECILCRGAEADTELERIEVWQDSHWRLTVSLSSEVAGFAYLEPKRHISHIHDLDGDEANTFGPASLNFFSTAATSASQAARCFFCASV